MKSKIYDISPLIIFILLTVFLYAGSTVVRNNAKYQFWELNKDLFYVDNTPLMTTLDAYKFTHLAELYRLGDYPDKNEQAYYPDGMDTPDPVPLLSFLMVKLAFLFDGNLYETGLNLIPYLAGLFIIPLCIYFYIIGLPIAGLIGGFAGTFAMIYIIRTNPGRVDTDSLNTFFPFLTALLILLASKSHGKKMYILAALTGLSQLIFNWWYHHSFFIIVYAGTLAATLFFTKHKTKNILIACGIYILCSNPMYIPQALIHLFGSFRVYVLDMAPKTNLILNLPNVYNTVSEAQKAGFLEAIPSLFFNAPAFYFGLAGLLVFSIRNFRQAIPFFPMYAVGFMSVIASIRYTIYLMPLIGIGFGYLINKAVLALPLQPRLRKLASLATAAVILMIFVLSPAHNGLIYQIRTSPSISSNIYKEIREMKEQFPAGSAIYSWWDYGLAITAETGFATFHDGMSQNTPKTWLIAKSMVSDPEKFYNILSYVANNGTNNLHKVQEGKNPVEFLQYLENYNEGIKKKNIYVLFTEDMIDKYQPISYIGYWDVINNKTGGAGDIMSFNCNRTTGTSLDCDNLKVDLGLGIMNSSVPLSAIAYVNPFNGTVYNEKITGFYGEYSLIAVRDPGTNITYAVFVVKTKDYNTNFVQMYLLGKYDKTKYREALLKYPVARAFEVLEK